MKAQTPLEVECRNRLGDLPILVDPDFGPVLRLLAEGVSEEDVLEGVVIARQSEFRPRWWRQVEKWARRAAMDRIAAAPRVTRPNSRDGPPAQVIDFHMEALKQAYASGSGGGDS